MALTERSFTRELCEELVREHGSIEGAAQAVAGQCVSERYPGRPVVWRTVRIWISKQVGPRRIDKHPLMARVDPTKVNRIEELLAKANIDPEAIGAIRTAKVKAWGYAMKGPDGQPIEGGLHATEVTLDPTPAWQPVQPAPDVIITSYRPLAPVKRGETERVFIVGDIQAGYVRLPNGSLLPFHDEAALEAQLQAIAVFKPHRIIILGDALDFAELSKYRQDPTFALTMQPAIDFLYSYLVRIRHIVGKQCQISYCAGNHEARLNLYVVDNARALYGLKPGGSKPEDWPLMSVPVLLRLDDLGIEYSDEYPSGEIYLTESGAPRPLLCSHTRPSNKKDRRASVIHGHEVELSCETWTIHTQDGEVTYERWCIPGTGNYGEIKGDKTRPTRTVTPSNRTRISATQAFALVHIDRATQDWSVVPVPIRRGRVIMPTGEKIVGDPSLLSLPLAA